MTQSVKSKIIARIHGKGRGGAYSAKDFLDLGSRGSVDVALSNLTRVGSIRRVIRGIYDFPGVSDELGGILSPIADQVAHAIARKHGWRILASGAQATNLLGLSTQVPAKTVYLSDGPSKTIKLGNQVIQFTHVEPKTLGTTSRTNGLIIQALRYLGKESVNPRIMQKLSGIIDESDRSKLLADTQYRTDWIHEIAKQVVALPDENDG